MGASERFLFIANPTAGDVSISGFKTRKVIAVAPWSGARLHRDDASGAVCAVLNRKSGDMAVIRLGAIKNQRNNPAALFTMIPVGSKPGQALWCGALRRQDQIGTLGKPYMGPSSVVPFRNGRWKIPFHQAIFQRNLATEALRAFQQCVKGNRESRSPLLNGPDADVRDGRLASGAPAPGMNHWAGFKWSGERLLQSIHGGNFEAVVGKIHQTLFFSGREGLVIWNG